MAKTIRFLVLFLTGGVVWFFVFSIPTERHSYFFLTLHHWISQIEGEGRYRKEGSHDDSHHKTQRPLNRPKIIEAMKNAF